MTPRPVRRPTEDGVPTVPARITEPRIVQINGRPVMVFEPPSPLPPSLLELLGRLRVTFKADVRPQGARRRCEEPEIEGGIPRDHRLVRFREGRHLGRDGIVRDLRLLMCADCEAVCVRDVSVDRIDRLPGGRLANRRRDVVLGWYTGARPNQRVYFTPGAGGL